MTDLPICGATWNGVGLTYICDQAPGHTGRHYAGHDGERIGWQPDTPTTCTSRTRGGFGTTYQCDQPAGHDGAHRTHRDGEYVAGWTDDAAELRRVTTAEQAENDHAREQGAERERLHHLTQNRLSEQIRATQKARQQRSEANERATKAERRAAQSEAERRHADNVIRATLAALGAGPDTDPVIKARETLARAKRWEKTAAELEAFRDAVYEELCITDSTPPDAAIGAIRDRAINIREQAQRAEKAIKRATEEYDRAEAAEATLTRVRDALNALGPLARYHIVTALGDNAMADAARRTALDAEQPAARDGHACCRHADEQPPAISLPLTAPCTRCDAATARCDANGRFLCQHCDSIEQAADEPAPEAAPDLTTPVTPRESRPVRLSDGHPVFDLINALTDNSALTDQAARDLIGRYYNAITNAPAARDAVERAVSELRRVLG